MSGVGPSQPSVLELRALLEEDARRQLAALAITATGLGEAPDALSAEDARARRVALTVIGRRREAGEGLAEAVADYVTETAFTLLDRAVALRCLEERGLLLVDGQPETVVKLDPVRGSSSLVWRVRAESSGRPPREVAREAFLRACAAVSERIRVLFDPDDEHAALFPLLASWERVVAVLNAPDVPAEAYAEDEVLGWVYQYWNSAAKRDLFERSGTGDKIERGADVAVASCTYTPRYIVDYIVQNTLGATWVELHPESALPATWPYYVRPPADNPPVTREPRPVREITLLDPACGSGHFLVRAFELFAQLYAEEGTEDPAEVPALILEHNLHGIDIDRRAVQIAALALYLKGCTAAGPDFRPRKLNLVAADIVLPPDPPPDFIAKFEDRDLADIAKGLWEGLGGIREFGSLLHPERTVNDAFRRLRARDRDGLWAKDEAAWAKRRTQLITELRRAVRRETGETDLGRHLFGAEAARGLDLLQVLGRHYDVVVANPPYVGFRKLGESVRAWLKREYPRSTLDLYVAFLDRLAEFTTRNGQMGVVSPQSWFTSSRTLELRRHFLVGTPATAVSLGQRTFADAQLLFVGLFTWSAAPQRSGDALRVTRLVDGSGGGPALEGAVRADRFRSWPLTLIEDLPAAPFLPDAPLPLIKALATRPTLGDLVEFIDGHWGGDNDRDTRQIWEVDPDTIGTGRAWRTLSAGKGYARWWRPNDQVCRAADELPSGPRWEYGRVAGGKLSTRREDATSTHLAGVVGLYARRDAPADAVLSAGAVMNSRIGTTYVRTLSSGLNFNPGYCGQIPLPRAAASEPVPSLVSFAVECVRLERQSGGFLPTPERIARPPSGWRQRH